MRIVFVIACVLVFCVIATAQPPQVVYPGPVTGVEITGEDWPAIVMHTRADGCPPCDRWIHDELPQALRAGLPVLIVPTNQGVTPRFRHRRGNETVQRDGYVTVRELRHMR
jgi:hypothetical protein